ncbi:MAG: AAA family ATPase [Polyangiaceae bacterium]
METRLCGRAAERRALLDALEGALGDARAGLVTVVGPPGAGRSRLLADFVRGLSVQSDLYVAMAAQCSPLTRDQGYGLIAALLRRWFRIHEGDSVAAARERLAFGLRWFENAQAAGATGGLLGEAPDGDGGGDTDKGPLDVDDDGEGGELDDCLDRLAELVTGVVPRPPGDSVPRDDSALAARARTAAAVAQLLSALAARAPLVLVCDDVHWADEASLELLDDLVGRLGDVPVLLACSARPELFERRPQWGEGAPWTQRIDLGPLPRRTIEEMVRDRLQRVADLDPEVVRVLAERAEGNPLTLVECLHLLVEAGIVETSGAAWHVHADRLGALELPATVQGLVQARLDRLDEGTRGVVGRAAVVGRSFWEGALEALVDSWRREAEAERAPPPANTDPSWSS